MGRETVVITGPERIEIVKPLVLPAPTESVTPRVTEMALVCVVGVPEITPLEEFKVSPVGRDPEVIAQVKGGVPPEAASVCA